MRLEAAEDKYVIEWEIDRSAVPKLPINDITLNVAVGQANTISAVDENGEELSLLYNEKTGVVSITTSGNLIELTFSTETAGNPLIGSYVPATLKNDRKWAWSHGIDGNINLEKSIAQFEKHNWQATLFLTGALIEQPNLSPGAITTERVQELLADGWSIGNQTYNYSDCEARPGTYEPSILDGQAVLEKIVAGSEKPNYPILSFAAPCFLSGFHSALINLRNSGTVSLRINESGSDTPLILDSAFLTQTVEDDQINIFDIDNPVGRDDTIDTGTLEAASQEIDRVARNSNQNRHLWYNTLSRSESNDNAGIDSRLGGLIEYVNRQYGPLGSNEVWVAPSDQIISYMTVRDLARFKVVSASRNSEPLPRDTIREVAPNSAGNLKSTGFLPTRIRPEDTPFPIEPEIITTQTPIPDSTVVAINTEVPEENQQEQFVPSEADAYSQADIARLSFGIVAALIILSVIIFGIRFRRNYTDGL